MNFIRNNIHCLPQLSPFDPQIKPDELLFVLGKLKQGKARGLYGFSNAELKHLSPDLLVMLLLLLNTFTSSSVWPQELCRATIALLAKVQCPTQPADARPIRPITFMATLYRLWGKCLALKSFRFFQKVFAVGSQGDRPWDPGLGTGSAGFCGVLHRCLDTNMSCHHGLKQSL